MLMIFQGFEPLMNFDDTRKLSFVERGEDSVSLVSFTAAGCITLVISYVG